MSFNSFSFILVFLPVVLILRHGLNKLKIWKLADLSLIAASLILYGLFSVDFVLILLLSAFITYFFGNLIIKADGSLKKGITIAAVILNLLPLAYFKYTNFFLENVYALVGKQYTSLSLVLPIGISFYTFSQIAYIIDTYRENTPGHPAFNEKERLGRVSVTEYLLYITYFPKIIQGPIALPYEMISQFRNDKKRTLDAEKFRRGLILFVIGLSKKMLLGDNLAKVADYGFKYTYYMDTITGILVLISYAFQLYFDFSGYSDMAEGISLMIGFELPQNFNSPYKARSVRNLWQRWHMTLTRFFVRYVYIPFGGSRKGKRRTALNVLIIFLLSGLWHGAGWTYLCWGLVMGIVVVFDDLGIMATKGDLKKHYLLREKPMLVIPEKLGQILTFCVFLISLVFFRSQDMTYAMQMFKQFFIFTWPGFMYKTSAMLDISENYLLLTAAGLYAKEFKNYIHLASWIILVAISFFVNSRKNSREIAYGEIPNKGFTALLIILFVWSFISLSQVSTFIYFQF
jgi:alginate O-acetyltransferase complex protein AlgI